MDREVTLSEMLDARERRAQRQAALLEEYHVPLVSFSMNIAGPVKDSALIRRAFLYGKNVLEAEIGNAVLVAETKMDVTGCEALYAVEAEAEALKQLCVSIEDSVPMGRLFDMDVLDVNGQKLARERERRCLVCGALGRGCASRRLHSIPELQAATRRLIETHFTEADRQRIADLVTSALIEEVRTTPKPGLVDLDNNGSHTDMNVSTFVESAKALQGYWVECVMIGQISASDLPEETFRRLRRAGIEAECTMLKATLGVNTHRGAIFLLGILCGAIGRLWKVDELCPDTKRILAECADMTAAPMRDELDSMVTPHTKGEALYLRHGMTGARGEAAAGLPSVRDISLPLFELALSQGKSRNDAGVAALIALIAQGTDTNMAARGGHEAAQAAAGEAAELIRGGRFPNIDEVRKLDEAFIRRNLSPGGCADLLAVTYFLHDLRICQHSYDADVNNNYCCFTY